MRNLKRRGKISSACEVTTISPFGVWVLIGGHEYYLEHDKFPWFREASVEDVLEVESPAPDHLYWPKLDVDLHLDSLEHPERYPLVAHATRAGVSERTRKRAAHS